MNKQCINCRESFRVDQFQEFKFSRDGYLLFCNACYDKLKDRPDFWKEYSEISKNHFSISQNLLDIFDHCSPGSVYYEKITIGPIPKRIPFIRVKRYRPKKQKFSSKQIIQYDLEGMEVGAFTTIFEAARDTGISSFLIAEVLDTEARAGGFQFVHSFK